MYVGRVVSLGEALQRHVAFYYDVTFSLLSYDLIVTDTEELIFRANSYHLLI